MQQHDFVITKKAINLAGRELIIETGKMAKQANGSALITYGKTTVLATATMGKLSGEDTDFFPLTVDYIEKMYAAGKMPGGFFKRETKPSTDATLTARLIDRAIRPLFPDGFRNPVHVCITPLTYDGKNHPEDIGIFAASVALTISDIPFHGPVAGVTVGIIDGEFAINPSVNEMKKSKLKLSVGGSESSVVMIEAGAYDINEATMLDAIYIGHESVKELCRLQTELQNEIGKEKVEIKLDIIPEAIIADMDDKWGAKIKEASVVKGKHDRQDAFDSLKEEIMAEYEANLTAEEFETQLRNLNNTYDELIKKYVRHGILYENNRADGRGMDDIRPISIEIDALPDIVHGSALFTRGETQALATVTLGSASDQQIVDGLDEEYKKAFYLHYNFPPYSVGEAGFMRGPGRRELGHGALAEKALEPIIPADTDFPYTIRVVSEIMESNGSSSMASVCSGCLAMMAAGVPIKAPVAGIANGLIMEGNDFVVLTDIQGLEDHLGDMDFKVTGTEDSITAVQMDIKIEGITKEIMSIALEKAKNARKYLLDLMKQVIEEPRKDLSPNAPRIESFSVDTSKIGEIIGASGKTIKSIIEQTKAEINIDDTGLVQVASPNKENLDLARAMIEAIITEPQRNQWYEGVISRIESFGIFVKFMHGFKEGMAHISQLPVPRGKQITEFFKLGDTVKARMLDSDRGKISLSLKEPGSEPERDERPERRDNRNYDRSRDNRDRDNRDRDNRSRGYNKRRD